MAQPICWMMCPESVVETAFTGELLLVFGFNHNRISTYVGTNDTQWLWFIETLCQNRPHNETIECKWEWKSERER